MNPSFIQILEQTPNRLVAVDPQYPQFGWVFIAFAVLLCVLGLILYWKTHGRTNALIFLVAGAFALIGAGALTGHSTITFSRETGQVRVEKTYFGKTFEPSVVQIAEIKSVEVRTTRNLSKVVLVLRSGDVFPLTSGSDRPGYEELADAARKFLARSGASEMPAALRGGFLGAVHGAAGIDFPVTAQCNRC
jgi:hypothetical protein